MSEANKTQIGGRHYKTSFEHWDLVVAVPLSYLEGCATKYVCRRNKKGNPVEDLKKALHFLNKMQEGDAPGFRNMTYEEIVLEVARFTVANSMDGAERRFVEVLSTWQKAEDLDEARTILFLMLDEAEKVHGRGPVPLTEENHHAERSTDGW